MLQWLRALLRRRKARAPAGTRVRASAAPASAPPAPQVVADEIADAIAPIAPVAPVASVEPDQPAEAPGAASAPAPPADPRIEQAVAALSEYFSSSPPRLGSFPGTAARILDVFGGDDPDFNRVVHELQQDAAVVTKLLNVANSAYFGAAGQVDDIRGAVLRIGMQDVEKLALAVAGQSLFETDARSAFSLEPARWNELFHTSMSAAFATSWLSQAARVGRSDQAFLAGLLHDIGRPVALRGLAQLVLDNVLEPGVLDVAEPILDRIHVELGHSVTAQSGLPGYLCSAAALHHDADVPGGPEHAELHLVRIIDGIAARRRAAPEQDALERSAAALSLDARWIRVAATEYETLAAQVTRMFGIADPFAPSAQSTSSAPSAP